MRPADVFLRLGLSFVGFFVVCGYCLLLAVLPLSSCSPKSSDPWKATLVFAAAAAPFVVLLPLGCGLPQVGSVLRWLVVPSMLLLALALRSVLPLVPEATLVGANLCHALTGEYPAAAFPAWHRFWAPTQLAVLLGLAWAGLRCWRAGSP